MLALATFSWLLTWPGKVEATEARGRQETILLLDDDPAWIWIQARLAERILNLEKLRGKTTPSIRRGLLRSSTLSTLKGGGPRPLEATRLPQGLELFTETLTE